MTLDEFRSELEKTIAGLNETGFDSVDSAIPEKLEQLISAAAELGMNEGKHLLENLSGAVKAITEGKSKAESGALRLTALEFYLKKLSDAAGNIEDL